MLDSPQEEVTSPVTPEEFGDALENIAPKVEQNAPDQDAKVGENPYESSQNEP